MAGVRWHRGEGRAMNITCSVVIPCYNYARFLDAAIRSALAQRDAGTEVIVVDDGSTDDTTAVARLHREVQLIRQPRRGVSDARNAGLHASRCEWIVFLDADDILLPDAVATGAGYLASNPEALLAAGRCRLIDRDGAELSAHWAPPPSCGHYRMLLSTNFIWTPGAALMRRSAVMASGGFCPDHPAAADYALYLRLARRGPFICHDRHVVMYRQHGANMSKDGVEMLRATLAVLGSERPFVPRELASDYRKSLRAWKDYYGDQIVESLRGSIRRPGEAARAARLGAALLRYHPRGFFRHLGRKLTVAAGIRRAERYPTVTPGGQSGAIPPRSEDGKTAERSSASR
jgi:glycosyltransferase involved in cell wall biosynthesis